MANCFCSSVLHRWIGTFLWEKRTSHGPSSVGPTPGTVPTIKLLCALYFNIDVSSCYLAEMLLNPNFLIPFIDIFLFYQAFILSWELTNLNPNFTEGPFPVWCSLANNDTNVVRHGTRGGKQNGLGITSQVGSRGWGLTCIQPVYWRRQIWNNLHSWLNPFCNQRQSEKSGMQVMLAGQLNFHA